MSGRGGDYPFAPPKPRWHTDYTDGMDLNGFASPPPDGTRIERMRRISTDLLLDKFIHFDIHGIGMFRC